MSCAKNDSVLKTLCIIVVERYFSNQFFNKMYEPSDEKRVLLAFCVQLTIMHSNSVHLFFTGMFVRDGNPPESKSGSDDFF